MIFQNLRYTIARIHYLNPHTVLGLLHVHIITRLYSTPGCHTSIHLDYKYFLFLLFLPLPLIELTSNCHYNTPLLVYSLEMRTLLDSKTYKCYEGQEDYNAEEQEHIMAVQYNVAAALSTIVPFNSRVHSPISESAVELGSITNCARWRRSG